MLILYTKTYCPYSDRVRDFISKMGIVVEERRIDKDRTYYDELIAKGGREETPFLVDTEHNIAMYESEDIVRYLNDTYGMDHAEGGAHDVVL